MEEVSRVLEVLAVGRGQREVFGGSLAGVGGVGSRREVLGLVGGGSSLVWVPDARLVWGWKIGGSWELVGISMVWVTGAKVAGDGGGDGGLWMSGGYGVWGGALSVSWLASGGGLRRG